MSGVSCIAGLVVQLSEQYNLPLKSGYNASRGFYIQLYVGPGASGEAATLTQENLPAQFLKVSRQRNTLTFITSDLVCVCVCVCVCVSPVY